MAPTLIRYRSVRSETGSAPACEAGGASACPARSAAGFGRGNGVPMVEAAVPI